ncbi:sulfurtransferase complex subunit TusB [Oceanicoccus sagamiensis]|uniref:Sulfurtransferase TusB n=1 Tax=Oceanicoccus sagamiensis TaxID=716816 RepID=A0A1X9NEP6_9GAMM|nr:sulfurtransferase complex subunit TusB [Oceanicoccus sagamiensis]ARN75524.1 hypothetical protein BST96_16260 [Oceanicoccus sagamiensis]
MILHTVNKSPFSDSSFTDCLKFCRAGSSVLLIEDGVYAGKKATHYSELIENHRDITFYALAVDVNARGLKQDISTNITLISDSEFVELTVTHHSVQSWF